jgi:outer membrane protein insertion porin family
MNARSAAAAALMSVLACAPAGADGRATVSAGFVGNDALSSGELAALVGAGGGFISWMLGPIDYDSSKIGGDAALIREHYRAAGFLDATVAPVAPATFVINEGRRYGYGSVAVAAGMPELSNGRLLDATGLKLGGDFDASEVVDAAESVSDEVASQGNPYADVAPQVTKDPETGRADVMFMVREGPRATVERVEVDDAAGVGETRVRGALKTEEGEPFNATKAMADENRLTKIEGLDRASVVPTPGSEPGKVVVKVKVENQ